MLNYLIELNTLGMKVPFRKFAEISTLTTFGSLFGRKYKTIDGLSSALMMLLAAPTGSGKGEAFTFWQKQFSRLTVNTNRPPNFYTGSATSAQGLHGAVQKIGTTVWIRHDAAGDLAMLAAPNGSTQIGFRDYVYELFDASAYAAAPMQPVASVAANMRKDEPIHNATVGMLWSTTPTAFSETYSQSVLSTGLGSRMLVTVHDAPAGDSVPDSQVLRDLPGTMFEILAGIANEVADLDAAYANPAEAFKRIARIAYSPDAAALLWRVEQAVNNVRRGVDNKRLPAHYAVFARTSMLTKKIALTAALVRNRFDCRIEYADVAYALAFVVRALGSLAAMFDSGAVGGGDDRARMAAIVGWLRTFATSNHPRVTTKCGTQ